MHWLDQIISFFYVMGHFTFSLQVLAFGQKYKWLDFSACDILLVFIMVPDKFSGPSSFPTWPTVCFFFLQKSPKRFFSLGKGTREAGWAAEADVRCCICFPASHVMQLSACRCTAGAPAQCVSLVSKVLQHRMKMRFIAQRVSSGIISDESPGTVLGKLLI